MAIVAHKGLCPIRGKRYGSVWQSNKCNPNAQEHPTEKPIDIIKKMVLSFSDENNLVLDSYLGSGTTAIAAKHLHRKFIGIEISPKYCEISRQRLAQDLLF